MRVAFLVPTIHDQGGTASAVATQVRGLVARPEVTSVRVVSVYRTADEPHFALPPGVVLDDLVDVRGETDDAAVREHPERLVRPEWDPTLDARGDLAVQRFLPTLGADVLVTVTPALLALAAQTRAPDTRLVHQEHRASSQRTSGLEPLLRFAPEADLLAVLAESMEHWLREQLGDSAPPLAVVGNALPGGYRPRSLLDEPLVVAAGRLVGEKQFPHLVEAFGLVADRLPGWRLRIFGEGPARFEIMQTVRRLGLYDRVELPGSTTDLASEWARASVTALASRAEGFPLVLQEAMAAGVPAVSYDCPVGPREIVEHGVDGLLVTPGSPQALAEALLALADDPRRRAAMGDAAHRAAGRFDGVAVTERWVGLYRALLEEGLPRPTAHRPQDVAPPGVGADEAGDALAVARAAAEHAAVELVVADDASRVVVPDAGRDAFLRALPVVAPPSLSLLDPGRHGWPARRGPVGELAPVLRRGRTERVRLEPWPLLAPDLPNPSSVRGLTVDLGDSSPDKGM